AIGVAQPLRALFQVVGEARCRVAEAACEQQERGKGKHFTYGHMSQARCGISMVRRGDVKIPNHTNERARILLARLLLDFPYPPSSRSSLEVCFSPDSSEECHEQPDENFIRDRTGRSGDVLPRPRARPLPARA